MSTFLKDQPLIWHLDQAQQADPKLCKQLDLTRLGNFPDMVIKLEEWRKSVWDSSISVDIVRNEEQLKQWIFVCAKSFDMNLSQMADYINPIFNAASEKSNHITFFLGSINGVPAGVSINSGGVSQSTIVWVGVLEKYRNRGLGRAMVESCLEVAKNEGSTTSMLNSFAAGKHLYETIGFKVENDLVVYSNDRTPSLDQRISEQKSVVNESY